MIEMVEQKTVTGLLLLEVDPEEDELRAIDEWFLTGSTNWNDVKTDVRIRLDTILNDFDGHEVEITIKSLKGPDEP